MYCGKISSRSRKVLLANKKIIHLPLPILHEKLNRKMLCVRIPCFKLHLKRSFCYEQFYFTSFAQAFPDDLEHKKTFGFPMFLGGIEREQWHEMG